MVGRDTELRTFDHALRQLRDGRGGAWLITGGAGLGKSRLLAELADRAGSYGVEVRRGFCLRGTSLPFFPWLQALPRRRTAAESGDHPWPPGPAGDPPTQPPQYPSEDRGLLDFLERAESAAGARPVLVLVDDFQWADRTSWRLLELLARHSAHLPLLVVGTCRDDLAEDPDAVAARGAWGELRRSDTIRHLPLAPLGTGESRRLVGLVRAPDASAPRATGDEERAIRLASGNPFFLIELATAPRSSTMSTPRGSPRTPAAGLGSRVPDPVRSLIEERIRRLTPDQLSVLQTAARLGSGFDASTLGDILGRPPNLVRRDLAVLVEGGWLVERRDPPAGQLTFGHDLLLEELSDTARWGAPPVLGLRIAAWWGRHRPEKPGELARLLEAAGAEPRAWEVAASAFEDAVRSRDLEAIERFARMLTRLEPEGPGRDQRIARRYLRAIWALRGSTSVDYRPLLRELESLGPPAPERWEAIQLRIECELATSLPDARRDLRDALAELRQKSRSSRAGADPFWGYLRASVTLMSRPGAAGVRGYRRAIRSLRGRAYAHERCRLAVLLGYNLQAIRTGGSAREAIKVAKRERRRYRLPVHPTGDIVAILEASTAFQEGDLSRALRSFERAIERFHADGHLSFEMSARHGLALVHLERGDLSGATRELALVRRFAFQFGRTPLTVAADSIEGMIAARRGRWAEAARWWDRAARRESHTGLPTWRFMLELWRARARAELGDVAAAGSATADLRIRRGLRSIGSALGSEAELNLARLFEIAGDARNTRRFLDRARRSAPDWTGQVAADVFESQWAGRQGRRDVAARAWSRAERGAARHGLRLSAIWPTAEEPSGKPLRRVSVRLGPATGPTLLAPGAFRRLDPSGPYSDVILEQLHRRAPTAGTGVRSSLPESAFVDLLQAPRERFVRALLRLTESGFLTRSRGRPHGLARTVWLYALTPAGAAEAARRRVPGATLGRGSLG